MGDEGGKARGRAVAARRRMLRESDGSGAREIGGRCEDEKEEEEEREVQQW